MSELTLSILIPTLVRRQEKFLQLMERLCPQCYGKPVEVVALQNQGEELLQVYRERLLNAAQGKYLCFVDDDDEVAPYYVDDILEALSDGWADVLGWRHLNTGTPGGYTDVSLAYKDGTPPGVIDGGYRRPFTHMNPVRSELARKGTFLSAGPGFTGEDMVFVRSVLPHLKREIQLPRPLYVYRWNAYDSTQSGPQPKPALAAHERPEIPYSCLFRWCE